MALSINEIKYVRSLGQKKYRQKYNKFVVEGDKMAREILDNQQFVIDAVYALPDWIDKHENFLRNISPRVKVIKSKELARISNLKSPNQVLLIVCQHDEPIDGTTINQKICLYLDSVRDPGNLGTILRIADWFGIPYVFRSHDTVEIYSPKVIQSSMGAFLRVKSPEISLKQLSNQFPEIPIYGAVMNGANVFELRPPSKGIVVVGNEGSGISENNLQFLQHHITIPKGVDGGAESLNVAVAIGIICGVWEIGL